MSADVRILVLEDDYILAENLKENLEELGYSEVLLCHHAGDALKAVRDYEPGLCIFDIHLGHPVLNGISLAQQVKDIGPMPIIFLSAYADQATRDEVMKTKPAGYIVKPATQEQLAASIDMAMNSVQNTRIEPIAIHEPTHQDYVFIKINQKYTKIRLADLIYLEADGAYTHLHLKDQKTVLAITLSAVLDSMASKKIIRTHRSYAVNIDFVESFDAKNIFLSVNQHNIPIPISSGFKESIKTAMGIREGWK